MLKDLLLGWFAISFAAGPLLGRWIGSRGTR
jgi:hypothetical protein